MLQKSGTGLHIDRAGASNLALSTVPIRADAPLAAWVFIPPSRLPEVSTTCMLLLRCCFGLRFESICFTFICAVQLYECLRKMKQKPDAKLDPAIHDQDVLITALRGVVVQQCHGLLSVQESALRDDVGRTRDREQMPGLRW